MGYDVIYLYVWRDSIFRTLLQREEEEEDSCDSRNNVCAVFFPLGDF